MCVRVLHSNLSEPYSSNDSLEACQGEKSALEKKMGYLRIDLKVSAGTRATPESGSRD